MSAPERVSKAGSRVTVRRPERLVVRGMALLALGIIVDLYDGGLAGALLTVAGLSAMVMGVHRLGREGPQGPARRPGANPG